MYFVLLIVFKGVLKLLEIAVVYANKNKLKRIPEETGAIAAQIFKDQHKIEVSLKFWHMVLTICLGIYFIIAFFRDYLNFMLALFEPISNDMLVFSIFTLSVVIMVILIFVVTELIPKSIAAKQASYIIKSLPVLIYIIYVLSKPFIFFCIAFTEFLIKLLNISNEYFEYDYSEEEIRMMVDASRELGNIDQAEIEMINNVFEFDNKTVGEVATHRTNIVAINVEASKSEIIKIITEEKYSRMPVYEENIDNIIGILHIKDILEYLIDPEAQIELNKIIRKAHFLPESKKTDVLFKEMQKNRVYMVIIVDEYGGTSGIVTMEDLTEEIVGNISDEYDDHEIPEIEKINESTFFISGVAEVVDVAQALDIKIEEAEEYDTIGGFLTGQLGHVPENGGKYEIEYAGVIFKINNVQDKRIMSMVAHKDV
jgi:putative hemolysin